MLIPVTHGMSNAFFLQKSVPPQLATTSGPPRICFLVVVTVPPLCATYSSAWLVDSNIPTHSFDLVLQSLQTSHQSYI